MKSKLSKMLFWVNKRVVMWILLPPLLFGLGMAKIKFESGNSKLLFNAPVTYLVIIATVILVCAAGGMPGLVQKIKRGFGHTQYSPSVSQTPAIESLRFQLVLFFACYILPLISILFNSPILCIFGFPLILLSARRARATKLQP